MGRKRKNDDGPSVNAVLKERKEGYAVVLHCGFRDLNGKATSRDKTLGLYDDLKKQYGDNYDKYIQEEIVSFRRAVDETIKTLTFTLHVNKECDSKDSQSLLFGAFYIRYVWNKLKIGEYLENIRHKKRSNNKAGHKYRFNFSEIIFSLVCLQILSPCSKHASFNNFVLLPYKVEDAIDAVYDALDVFAEHAELINDYTYKEASAKTNNGEKIYFYDVSDVRLSANADINTPYVGLKKSKEGIFGPKIQFGMLIDSMGFILGVLVFKGSDSEQPTLIKQIESIAPHIDMDNVVICTDAGLCSFKNKQFLSERGRGYIVTQPLLGKFVPDFVRNWATENSNFTCPDNEGNYIVTSPSEVKALYKEMKEKGNQKAMDILYNLTIYKDRLFKMDVYVSVPQNENEQEEVKEIIYKEDPDNTKKVSSDKTKRKKMDFVQRLFVSWSMKYEDAQLESLEEEYKNALNDINKKSDISGSSKSKGYTRFIKRIKTTKDGEVATEKADSFNCEKYEKEKALAGFYCQATNLKDPAWELFKISRERWQIEWCFRTMKTHLGARPIYLRTEAHRKAHIFLVAMSLNILRYISYEVYAAAGVKKGTKLGRVNKKNKTVVSGISIDSIINSLRYLRGCKRMSDQKIEAYCSGVSETETTRLMAEAFGFSLTKEATTVKMMEKLVS